MAELWYGLVAILFAGYAILDGFDLGAGALHLLLARSNAERRTVLQAIGPLWDGNEVWLIAAGGSLFLSFPAVLAIGFSGFYLPIFILLWLLLLRGISIEFRSHLKDPMWQGFWDTVFSASSFLLALVFGVALGNVLRGVPLQEGTGAFRLPLFASGSPTGELGLLDWYTFSVGIFVLLALCRHGALFLALRAGEPVAERARSLAKSLHLPVLALWLGVAALSLAISPHLFEAFRARPLAWVLFSVSCISFVISMRNRNNSFLLSLVHLGSLFLLCAACQFPYFLKAPLLQVGLDIAIAKSPDQSLRTALFWWLPGFPLALFYFFFLWRMHRRPVVADEGSRGY